MSRPPPRSPAPAGAATSGALVARGPTGVALVTSDAHTGLVDAIGANLPGAAWQRRTHYTVNLMAVCPKPAWGGVKAMLHSVCEQVDAEAVHARYDKLLDHVRGLPEVHDHLDAAREEILAFTAFPPALWRQIHHAFLVRMRLGLIDQHTTAIEELTNRIEVVIQPFRGFCELISSIPGVGTTTAQVITAENGADMTRFPPRATSPPGPGCVPDTTSPPAGPRTPTPAPAIPTSRPCSAPPR